METYTIGIDPGTPTSGIGLIDFSYKVLYYNQIDTNGKNIYAELKHCRKLMGCWPPQMWIEDQFIPGKGGKNQADRAKAVHALITARRHGEWLGVADLNDIEYTRIVHPSTWKSAVYGKCYKSEDQKKLAVNHVKMLWNIKLIQKMHHAAEALLIARYGTTMYKRAFGV